MTDIHGVVEVYSEDMWNPVMPIVPLLSRNYGTFGSLFGVQNIDDFNPIAYGRGIPNDVSLYTKNAYTKSNHFHSASNLTYEEIRQIDWTEKGNIASALRQRCDSCGTLESTTTDLGSFTEGQIRQIHGGENVKIDDVSYAGVIPTRAERLTKDWKDLFAIMRCLADRYGDKNVRLIVWFDD